MNLSNQSMAAAELNHALQNSKLYPMSKQSRDTHGKIYGSKIGGKSVILQNINNAIKDSFDLQDNNKDHHHGTKSLQDKILAAIDVAKEPEESLEETKLEDVLINDTSTDDEQVQCSQSDVMPTEELNIKDDQLQSTQRNVEEDYGHVADRSQQIHSDSSSNDDEPSQSSTKEHNRGVSFGLVHVRHYEIILSDHPGTRGGPSIGIGWRYMNGGSFKLKYWENRLQSRRSSDQLVITRKQREELLRDVGYVQDEIAAMVRSTYRSRWQRKRTVGNLVCSKFEEKVERVYRKVLSVLRFGRKRTLKWDEKNTETTESSELISILKPDGVDARSSANSSVTTFSCDDSELSTF